MSVSDYFATAFGHSGYYPSFPSNKSVNPLNGKLNSSLFFLQTSKPFVRGDMLVREKEKKQKKNENSLCSAGEGKKREKKTPRGELRGRRESGTEKENQE